MRKSARGISPLMKRPFPPHWNGYNEDCARAGERGRERAAVLENGCACGYFLEHLISWKPSLHITGADIIDQPLRRLAERMQKGGHPIPLLRFDLTSCPLPDASQDVVVALNVLEHIEDHTKAVREIQRILKPGGSFVFELPAGPDLYDDYDRELHHYRRYNAAELEQLLTGVGLEKQELTHLGAFMYPGFWAVKKWRSAHPAPRTEHSRPLEKSTSARLIRASGGAAFKALFALELWLGKRVHYPVGIRCCGTFIKK